jgi:FixJ family two-component response regulator
MATTPHVFIVDDDPSVLTAMKRLLRSGGFDVDTFSSGQAFLDAVSPEMTGCAILDVQMPGMNGLELQEEMNSSGYKLSVVFITAHPTEPDRHRALRGGAIQYLEKPVSAEVLLPCVGTGSHDGD